MARMKRLQFMIEPELDEALEAAALRERVSKAALIRRWIGEHLPPLPPLEEDPLWEMVGAFEAEPLPPGVTLDDVIYGKKAGDRRWVDEARVDEAR